MFLAMYSESHIDVYFLKYLLICTFYSYFSCLLIRNYKLKYLVKWNTTSFNFPFSFYYFPTTFQSTLFVCLSSCLCCIPEQARDRRGWKIHLGCDLPQWERSALLDWCFYISFYSTLISKRGCKDRCSEGNHWRLCVLAWSDSFQSLRLNSLQSVPGLYLPPPTPPFDEDKGCVDGGGGRGPN